MNWSSAPTGSACPCSLPGARAIAGVIERVSYTGDAISVAVKAGNRLLQAQMPTSSGDLPRPGDAAYLSWEEQDAYLLPTPVETPAPVKVPAA